MRLSSRLPSSSCLSTSFPPSSSFSSWSSSLLPSSFSRLPSSFPPVLLRSSSGFLSPSSSSCRPSFFASRSMSEALSRLATMNLKQQSVEVPSVPVRADEGPVRRHSLYADGLVHHFFDEVETLFDGLQRASRLYPNRDYLGYRPGGIGNYVWLSFSQVMTMVNQIGSALKVLGVSRGSNVGLFSKNRYEWVASEYACYRQSAVPVAIYDTFGESTVTYCMNHAEVSVLFCGDDKLVEVERMAANCEFLRHIIVFGSVDLAPIRARLLANPKSSQIRVYSFNDILEKGQEAPSDGDPPGPKDIALLMYTSGTTGVPKGVLQTHAAMISSVAACSTSTFVGFDGDIHVSYLPLSHIMERLIMSVMMHHGTSAGFYSGDVKLLLDDVKTMKPTMFAGVPRVFERIEDKIMSQNKSGFKKWFLDKTLAALGEALDNKTTPPFWTKLVTNKARSSLGGNLRFFLTGSAPLSVPTHRFMRMLFQVPVIQGYGLTETCACTSIAHYADIDCGHVGPPQPNTEIKLRAVPEMGYTNPVDHGGEILVRGPGVTIGYYKMPERTKEDIDEEGWFATGDIGIWTDTGCLKIIDRKKNMFKTSLGEYIASERIETVLKKSRFVVQAFVYGDAETPYIVAVVTVNTERVKDWSRGQDQQLSKLPLFELLKTSELQKAVLEDLVRVSKEAKLQKYETVKAVRLEAAEWTVDNGMMTPSFKLRRHELSRRYVPEIDSMYRQLLPNYVSKNK